MDSPSIEIPQQSNRKRSSLGTPSVNSSAISPLLQRRAKTPLSPSASRSNSLRRNGSLGRASPKTTVPQGPTLATQKRSQVRPCKCGQPGHFQEKGHKDHGHEHQKVVSTPSVEKPSPRQSPVPVRKPTPKPAEKVLRKKSSTASIASTASDASDAPQTINMFTSSMSAKVDGPCRFISTMFWYPRLEPVFFTNTVQVNSNEDSSFIINETTTQYIEAGETKEIHVKPDRRGSAFRGDVKNTIAASRVRNNEVTVS